MSRTKFLVQSIRNYFSKNGTLLQPPQIPFKNLTYNDVVEIPTPKIQNIVSTVNLGCELKDLKDIALKARNTEYNPKRFAALIMRIHVPQTTALIFKTGKMVCTGAKTETDSKIAARKFARILQKLDFKVKFSDFKIQNIVCSVDVKFSIRLEKFCYSKHAMFCKFEPEVFPGLVYRMAKSKTVLLIFTSGKIVITGAKTFHEAEEMFGNIYPVLKECKRNLQ